MLPQNADAANVYLLARNQVVTAGMGTVVDIDFNAVKFVMDLYEVADQRACFMKVRDMFHEFKPREKK